MQFSVASPVRTPRPAQLRDIYIYLLNIMFPFGSVSVPSAKDRLRSKLKSRINAVTVHMEY